MKHILKTLAMAAFIVAATTSFKTTDRSPASVHFKHTYSDLGELQGEGETIHQAQANVSIDCFEQRMDAYAAARGGGVPDDEQADMIIEDCVNIK